MNTVEFQVPTFKKSDLKKIKQAIDKIKEVEPLILYTIKLATKNFPEPISESVGNNINLGGGDVFIEDGIIHYTSPQKDEMMSRPSAPYIMWKGKLIDIADNLPAAWIGKDEDQLKRILKKGRKEYLESLDKIDA